MNSLSLLEKFIVKHFTLKFVRVISKRLETIYIFQMSRGEKRIKKNLKLGERKGEKWQTVSCVYKKLIYDTVGKGWEIVGEEFNDLGWYLSIWEKVDPISHYA